MKPWLTLPEYLAASGLSRRSFFRNARPSIESKTIDGVLKYSAASLTEAQRDKLDGQQTSSPTETTALAAPLFAGTSLAVQTRITLTPEAQQQAEERYSIIKPLLDFVSDASTRGRYSLLNLKDGRSISNADLLCEYLSELHSRNGKKIGRATIWRWKKAYSEGGFNALARTVRADKGSSKFFTKFPAAAQLVSSIWLKPHQTVALAYNALMREHAVLDIAPHELPSYETVRAYLESIPAPAKVLTRQGERAHDAKMSLYTQRQYTDIRANGIWVADHMIHDVEVRNDCFYGVDENAPMRLRFSAIEDLRSRKIVGYCWVPEGNSRAITTALRNAVKRYGPCDTFYCDNGKDYQKVAKGAHPGFQKDWVEGDVAQIQKSGVLQQLGISVQFCIPYHPQSKSIERLFRTLHLKFDALFPHYTTGSAYTRPDQTVVAMAMHRKLLKMDRANESPLIPASHFIRMATAWIEQDYNAQHSHNGRGMNGRTPDDVFNELYPLDVRRTVDPAVLEGLLWERKKVTVRNMAITLNKRRYMASSPESSAAMYLKNTEEVLVCYDPHDLDQAIVADLDGRKIAEIQAEVLLPHSAEAGPMIAASMQERKRLKKATVSTVRRINDNVANMGFKSDLERLHERALLPMAVGDSIVHRMEPVKDIDTTNLAMPRYSHDIAAEFLSEEL